MRVLRFMVMVAPVFDSEQTLSNVRKNGVRKKEVHLNSLIVSPRLVSQDYQNDEDTLSE